MSNVNIAPSGTIATMLDVIVAAGVCFGWLITKPAGTVRGAPFAPIQSLLDLVRNTSKSFVTLDLDSTEVRLANSK